MKKDCSTCLCRECSCYPSITIFDKDKTCRSYTPDYEGYITELEKKNNELKTVKIPQLENKIASIRGAHSVDCKKLNARIEQVERLKNENAKLKEKVGTYQIGMFDEIEKRDKRLTKAEEILREYIRINLLPPTERNFDDEVKLFKEAEQFLN